MPKEAKAKAERELNSARNALSNGDFMNAALSLGGATRYLEDKNLTVKDVGLDEEVYNRFRKALKNSTDDEAKKLLKDLLG